MSFYREQLESWLSQVDVSKDRILDVGGGQKPIPKRVHSWRVKEYRILDNDSEFTLNYFADLNYPLDKNSWDIQLFDGVFCLEVMEYIWNPVQAMKNLADCLDPGGVLWISFPTLYPLHNPPGIDFLRYSKNAIEKLLSVSGFQTWEITPRVATLGKSYLFNFYHTEGMRAMKDTTDIFHIGYCVKAWKAGE